MVAVVAELFWAEAKLPSTKRAASDIRSERLRMAGFSRLRGTNARQTFGAGVTPVTSQRQPARGSAWYSGKPPRTRSDYARAAAVQCRPGPRLRYRAVSVDG